MLGIAPCTEHPAPMEASLVQRCRARDAAAWRALHETYLATVRSFLGRLGVEAADLEDACQEVFVSVYRYLPTFRGEASLKSWIFRLCVTEARKTRRQIRVAADTVRLVGCEDAAGFPANDAPGMSPERARQHVDAALASLGHDERLIFILFEMQGLSGNQVAARAGCAVSRVWQHLHHARRKFRTVVESGPCSRSRPVEPRDKLAA